MVVFPQYRMEIIHRTRRNADAMRIQKMCLVILRQLSILDPDCSLALSTCDPLLAHCFRLLKSTTLTETACDLIEHLLLSRNDLVQLDGFSKCSWSQHTCHVIYEFNFPNFQRDFMTFCNNWTTRLYLRRIVSSHWLSLMSTNAKTEPLVRQNPYYV